MALSEVPEDLEEVNTPLQRIIEGVETPAFLQRSKTQYETTQNKFGPKQSNMGIHMIIEQSSVSNLSLESMRKPKFIINDRNSQGGISFRPKNSMVMSQPQANAGELRSQIEESEFIDERANNNNSMLSDKKIKPAPNRP
jgi:hypothetical protein